MTTPADAYFAAGDLVNFGSAMSKTTLDRMGEIMRPHAEKVYVMPGNHESEADIESFCSAFHFVNFHGGMAEIGGLRFAGLGYSTITPFRTPGEYTEEQIAERLRPFAAYKPEVLICHSPPYGTPLDRIREGLHGGSHSVRAFIEEHQPAHFFCGHIHEAAGLVVQIGRTKAMNVGKAGYLLEYKELG